MRRSECCAERMENGFLTLILRENEILSFPKVHAAGREGETLIPCVPVMYNQTYELFYPVRGLLPICQAVPRMDPDERLRLARDTAEYVFGFRRNTGLHEDDLLLDIRHVFLRDGHPVFLYLPLDERFVQAEAGAAAALAELISGILDPDIPSPVENPSNMRYGRTNKIREMIRTPEVSLQDICGILRAAQEEAEEEERRQYAREAVKKRRGSAAEAYPGENFEAAPRLSENIGASLSPSENSGAVPRPVENAGAAPEMNPEKAGGPGTQPLPYELELTELNSGKKIRIGREPFTFGRQSENPDGRITDDRAVSRQHCRIFYDTNRYYIQDLGSTNGTGLNGKRLPPEKVGIHDGDVIKVVTHNYLVHLA